MISVVINTLNEERNIKRAIASVAKFSDEIVVVDMKSDDDTCKIAESMGAKVFEHERTGYVEPARNYAISKATGDWVLILDADEEVSTSLGAKLKQIVYENQCDYLRLPRKNIIFGKWMKHSRWWPDYNIRFFKKDNVTWGEAIHSVPVTKGVGADLDDKEEYALVHYHYETIEQYISRLNRYTTEHAKNINKQGYQFKWSDIVNKPSGEFYSRYFFGQGYKDGLHGLALSLLQSFSELVLYLKLWQYSKFEDKHLNVNDVVSVFDKTIKDLSYWEADTMVKEHGGLKYRIKRKLKI